jgi:carotenoid cleavage dioxygenase-like enzyme
LFKHVCSHSFPAYFSEALAAGIQLMATILGFLFSLVLSCVEGWDDSGFFGWFADSLDEAHDVPLIFDGKVPAFLTGTFVHTGPGRFGFGKMRFTHMMDGYAKTVKIDFSQDGKVLYTTEFLASGFLNASNKSGEIARGMFVGPIEPNPHWGPTAVLGANDNNYIKMRRLGDHRMLLADTMIATKMQDDCVSLDHNVRPALMKMMVPGVSWTDSLEPFGDMCMLGTMAHAHEDSKTGVMTGSMGCTGLHGNYHIVFTIEPSSPTTRKLLAKIALPKGRRPSYMHSLGATPNFIILIAEPIYMNMEKVLLGDSLGRGGLDTTNENTLFQVVNRKTGEVRILEAPGFAFGHLLNAWEDGEDIVIDLTWYAAGNQTTLGWFNRWFLENMQDKGIREEWPRSKIMRYKLGAKGDVRSTPLFADEREQNDFETPKINENFDGHKYCVSYMLQFHSYEYDKDRNASVSGPFGAVGIAKRNVCTGERNGWYRPNEYPSEVQFVANPEGTAEDDGVLLSMVYDGNTNSSYFQILDARNMERLAKAPVPVKSPFLIHSSYFPSDQVLREVLV